MKILSVLLVGLAALASPFAVVARAHPRPHHDLIDASNIAQAFAEMVRATTTHRERGEKHSNQRGQRDA